MQYKRRIILRSIRDVLQGRRKELMDGLKPDVSLASLARDIEDLISDLSSFKLRPLINATGVVIHTNLGRAILAESALRNITDVAKHYSNLEYELSRGRRGKRYTHLLYILRELSGAEEAIVVNNNAAAVLLCLNTFAKEREVIVSRGELVEIGGSFRIPEVMQSSGAVLREVGATNKTHLADYENALSGRTALLLKVHSSNYRITGFTEEVGIEELVRLGQQYRVPVMTDLGSGCMVDLGAFGIDGEPTVQSIIGKGVDIVTFSGDKLLGGPQAGIIIGRKRLIRSLQKNPLLRAIRIDKLTLAALEATLMHYLDEEEALKQIPVLNMLTCSGSQIRRRAKRICTLLSKAIVSHASVSIVQEQSRAGGGALPGTAFPTSVVSVKPKFISVNALEERLRKAETPLIARIKGETLLFDPRTVLDGEIKTLVQCVISAFEKKDR